MLFELTQLPVLQKFGTVQFRPIKYEHCGTARQLAFDDDQSSNVDESVIFAILCVKMRRCVLVPIHVDQDSEELTDGWHRKLYRFPG